MIVVMVFWGMAACAGLVVLAAIFVELWRVRVVLERVDRRLVAGLEMRQALAGEEEAQAGRGGQDCDTERLGDVDRRGTMRADGPSHGFGAR